MLTEASLIHDDVRIWRIVSDFIQTLDFSNSLKPEELTYTVLKGGRSQAAIYRFSIHEHTYVLRLFPPQAKQPARLHQVSMAKQAGKIGAGPKVFFTDPQLEGIIIDYIPGRTVHPMDFEDPDRLAQFACFLRCLHQSSEPFPVAISPFRRFHDFLGRATQYHSHLWFAEVKEIIEKLEAALQLYRVPNVPTHLDLNPLNIMLTKEGFLLVDWVNGGMSDPYFDLAAFSIFHNLNESQSQAFLNHYFDRCPTQTEWSRFVIIQPIRLFVIAAAFLSVSQEDNTIEASGLPTLADFMLENAAGKTDQSCHQIGSIMLNAGLNLIQGKHFQAALKSCLD